MTPSTSDWVLAVDFGTTFTSAAVVRDGRVEVLEVDGFRRFPSCVVWIDRELVVGAAAEHQQVLHPGATERNPKRYLGLRDHLLLGEQPVAVVDAVGAVLGAVYVEATRRQGGQPPRRVRLTHPARWGAARLDSLRAAASRAGMDDVEFLAEPVAAALHYGGARIGVGEYVGVYDLGGGTFDTAVLRRTGEGFELAGPPGGDDRLGGEDFDHRLMDFLLARLSAEEPDAAASLRESDAVEWRRANAQLLTEAKQAKEALSRQTTYTMLLPAPISREMRVTRPEFEALVRADVQATIDEFRLTIDRAGLELDDLAARYLTGGSSRIPLVSRLLHETFDQAPDTYDDPKTAVAMGAAEADALYFRAPAVVAAAATVVLDEETPTAPETEEPVEAEPPTEEVALVAAPVPDDRVAETARPLPEPAAQIDALPPPPEVEPATDESESQPSEPIERESDDRSRRILVVAGLAAVAVLLAAVLVVRSLGGGDDDTTLTAAAEDAVTSTDQLAMDFESASSADLRVERRWNVEGSTFRSEEKLTNTGAEPSSGFHDIVVPKSVAADASQVTWETPGAQVVQADPIFRFTFENLEPGASVVYRYTVDLGGKQVNEQVLKQWRQEHDQSRDAHLAALSAEAEQLALAAAAAAAEPSAPDPSAPLLNFPSTGQGQQPSGGGGSSPTPGAPTPAQPTPPAVPAPSASISGPGLVYLNQQYVWSATSRSNVARCRWRLPSHSYTQDSCDDIWASTHAHGCYTLYLDVWNSENVQRTYEKQFCTSY